MLADFSPPNLVFSTDIPAIIAPVRRQAVQTQKSIDTSSQIPWQPQVLKEYVSVLSELRKDSQFNKAIEKHYQNNTQQFWVDLREAVNSGVVSFTTLKSVAGETDARFFQNMFVNNVEKWTQPPFNKSTRIQIVKAGLFAKPSAKSTHQAVPT